MTTIRDELAAVTATTWDAREETDATLEALGIDPDLPAEWATVDRCLTWLRERGFQMGKPDWSVGGPIIGGWTITVSEVDDGPRFTQAAPTLHAALIAACRAVQAQEEA